MLSALACLLYVQASASATTGTLYMMGSHFSSGTYYRFDIYNYSVIDETMIGFSVVDVCGVPGGTKFYVSDNLANSIYVMSSYNDKLGTIRVGGPGDMDVDSSGTYLYVTSYAEPSVYVVDAGSDSVMYTVPMPGFVTKVRVSSVSNGVFCLPASGGSIYYVDSRSMTSNTAVVLPDGWEPQDLDVSPDGARLAVLASNSTMCMVFMYQVSKIVENMPWHAQIYEGQPQYAGGTKLSFAPDNTLYVIEDYGSTIVHTRATGLPADNVSTWFSDMTCLRMTSDGRLWVSYGRNISVYHTSSGVWLANITCPSTVSNINFYVQTLGMVNYAPQYVTLAFKYNSNTPAIGVRTTVYEPDGRVLATKYTDASGQVNYQLYKDKTYTIWANNTTTGVNMTFLLSPSSAYYTITLPATGGFNPTGGYNTSTGTWNGTGDVTRDINSTVVYRQDPDLNTGYISVYYSDWTHSTTNLTVLVYQRGTDSNNLTLLDSESTSTFTNGVAQWHTVPVLQNVVENYGFEYGESGWMGWGGGGPVWTEVVSTSPYEGARCAKMSWINATSNFTQSLLSKQYPVVSGRLVNVTAHLRTTDAPQNVYLILLFRYANGTDITAVPVLAAPGPEWSSYSVFSVAPGGAAYFAISITAVGAGYDNLYIDDCTANTLTETSGSDWYTFVLPNASGTDVVVKFVSNPTAYHGDYRWTSTHHFKGVLVRLPGMPQSWYFWISTGMIFVAVSTAVIGTAAIAGGIACVFAAIFYYWGWFDPLGGDLTLIAIGVAFAICVGMFIIEKERR